MKRKIPLLLILAFVSVSSLKAQDIHFSQYYRTPMLVNPAMTGIFNGNVRAIINNKDQWKSIGLYRTSGAAFDMNLMKKKWNNAFLGGGIAVFADKVGSFKLSTTKALGSFSSIVSLNDQNKLSAGLQGSLVQRSLDNSQLQWPNQYDPASAGGYNANFDSRENLMLNEYYGDFSTGIAWNFDQSVTGFSDDKQFRANAGVAFHHLNRPALKLTTYQDKLYSKMVAHGGMYISIRNNNMALLPSVLYNMQGPAKELVAGMLIRYTVKEGSKYTGFFKETAVLLGGHFRVGDAIIPTVMVEFTHYALAISYDVNTSSLSSASNMKGGLEFSLSFINPNPFRSGTSKSVRFL